jgi:hypothetical protein
MHDGVAGRSRLRGDEVEREAGRRGASGRQEPIELRMVDEPIERDRPLPASVPG